MNSFLTKFKLPLILVFMLVFAFLFGDFIPTEAKAALFAISLTLKAILFAILPFIIFSFLFGSIVALQNGAIAFIALLFIMVYCSNFLAIIGAEAMGHVALSWLHIPENYQHTTLHELKPLWDFSIPRLIRNETALLGGLALGLVFSFYPNPMAVSIATRMSHLAGQFLRHIFIPILPLFIMGFVFKIQHDGMLERVVMVYGSVLFIVVTIQCTYIGALYFIAAKFSTSQFLFYVRNVLPAAFTGFTTMSSAAALPLSIIAAEKNTNDPEVGRAVAPASVNIHTLGSAIGMTTLAMATLLTFHQPLPTLFAAVTFALYYAVAKFAVAGVPGGAIFVAIPLLESRLGFTSEMSGVLTTAYMFFDPFGTAANVFGNGAFAIIFSKLFRSAPAPKEADLLAAN
jgi:Na+/H+-dicarboxylate symporter